MSSLNDAERRKLAAVADQALALADGGKLHLLQERHGNGDYSYWAVARTPARPLERVPSRFPIDQRSRSSAPMTSDRYVSTQAIREAVKGRETEVLEALGIAVG